MMTHDQPNSQHPDDYCEQRIGLGLKCGLQYGHQDDCAPYDRGSVAAWIPVVAVALALAAAALPGLVTAAMDSQVTQTLATLAVILTLGAAVAVLTTHPMLRDDQSPTRARRQTGAGQ